VCVCVWMGAIYVCTVFKLLEVISDFLKAYPIHKY
jgi:hypothetical protein